MICRTLNSDKLIWFYYDSFNDGRGKAKYGRMIRMMLESSAYIFLFFENDFNRITISCDATQTER